MSPLDKVSYCQEAPAEVLVLKTLAPAQPDLRGKCLPPSTPSTHSGLSGELCPDVDEVLLQQPLLVGNLLKVLGLVSVLIHLSVQHLQHRL